MVCSPTGGRPVLAVAAASGTSTPTCPAAPCSVVLPRPASDAVVRVRVRRAVAHERVAVRRARLARVDDRVVGQACASGCSSPGTRGASTGRVGARRGRRQRLRACSGGVRRAARAEHLELPQRVAVAGAARGAGSAARSGRCPSTSTVWLPPVPLVTVATVVQVVPFGGDLDLERLGVGGLPAQLDAVERVAVAPRSTWIHCVVGELAGPAGVRVAVDGLGGGDVRRPPPTTPWRACPARC